MLLNNLQAQVPKSGYLESTLTTELTTEWREVNVMVRCDILANTIYPSVIVATIIFRLETKQSNQSTKLEAGSFVHGNKPPFMPTHVIHEAVKHESFRKKNI